MSVSISLFAGAGAQLLDNNTNPLSGGKIYTYAAGTTTPQSTYTSNTGGTPHANPIILDSSGRIPGNEMWVTDGVSYKFVVKDSTDVTLYTIDNIIAPYINNDLASTTDNSKGDALVGFRQSLLSGFATGSVGRTQNSKAQERVSVYDFIPPSEIADIQNGVSNYDCLTAFQNAINCCPTGLDSGAYRQGVLVEIPPGKYYLSATLQIDRNVTLRGVGAPYGNCTGIVILDFADNVDGIKTVDYRDSPSGKQGSGVTLEGFYMIRRSSGGTLGSGISIKTMTRIESVTVYGFREHGILIDASTSYTPASNANLWEIRSCTVDSNGSHGLYVKGADANAGAAYNLNAKGNGGWGIYDSSFLGNTYVACHAASNTLGPYKSDNNNARNSFIGCYAEGGQPASSIAYPSIAVGGIHSPGFGATDSYILGGIRGFVINPAIDVPTVYFGYGQSATSGTLMSYNDTSGSFAWTLDKAVGRIGYKWANLSTPDFLMWYDRTATVANGYARDLSTANGALGINEHYFGSISQMKYRGLGTSAPAAGTWLQGDIVWNSSPTAGGFIGWVCTTGGTPGTWKTFGAISV